MSTKRWSFKTNNEIYTIGMIGGEKIAIESAIYEIVDGLLYRKTP